MLSCWLGGLVLFVWVFSSCCYETCALGYLVTACSMLVGVYEFLALGFVSCGGPV